MSEADKEEKQIAIGNNCYHDPSHISAVSMIVDGGWPKHSHWHPYNTKSGVAIILLAIKATGKILHMSVCNEYCYI